MFNHQIAIDCNILAAFKKIVESMFLFLIKI